MTIWPWISPIQSPTTTVLCADIGFLSGSYQHTTVQIASPSAIMIFIVTLSVGLSEDSVKTSWSIVTFPLTMFWWYSITIRKWLKTAAICCQDISLTCIVVLRWLIYIYSWIKIRKWLYLFNFWGISKSSSGIKYSGTYYTFSEWWDCSSVTDSCYCLSMT